MNKTKEMESIIVKVDEESFLIMDMDFRMMTADEILKEMFTTTTDLERYCPKCKNKISVKKSTGKNSWCYICEHCEEQIAPESTTSSPVV